MCSLKTMRKFILFFCVLVSFSGYAEVLISGLTYPPKRNSDIIVYGISDFISDQNVEMARTKVSDNGRFILRFELKHIQKIKIKYDNKFCWMYVQPNGKYAIEIPEKDQATSGFKEDNETEMLFLKLEVDDINYKILGFEAWLDETLGDIFMLKDARPGEFIKRISDLKKSIEQDYKTESDTFFVQYIKYSVGVHVDNFSYLGGLSYDEKFDFYFGTGNPLFYHDKFMEYFHLFFARYYFQTSKEIRTQLYQSVIAMNAENFMKALAIDPYLKNEDLRVMVALKTIRDEMYSKELPRTNLCILLQQLSLSLPTDAHRKCAKQLHQIYSELIVGQRIPDIVVENGIQLSNWSQKAIYIHFFDPSNQRSLAEIGILKKLQEKYGEVIEFVTFYQKNEAVQNTAQTRALEAITWKKFELPVTHEIWTSLKVKTFPYYILLDEKLILHSAPALAPSPNGNYETIEKTFYEMKRNKELKN
jgi:hypothetical protein